MRIEFEFDKSKVEVLGHTLGDVYRTIKQEFQKAGIPCVADGDILAFEDRGRKEDFSNMWLVIMPLTRSEWFLNTAKSCFWFPTNHRKEDVLAKAKKNLVN